MSRAGERIPHGQLARPGDVAANLDLPLVCPDRVVAVTHEFGSVVLTCSTTMIERFQVDRTGTALETAAFGRPGPTATVRFDVLDPHVIRVRAELADEVGDRPGHLVEQVVLDRRHDATVVVDDNHVVVETGALRLRVDRTPMRYRIERLDGTRLVETIPAAVYLDPPTGATSIDGHSLTDAWPWYFRGLTPLGWVIDTDGTTVVSETSIMSQHENFYGLGERYLGFAKRGQRVDLWHMNAAGQTWPASYKNVPFHLSTLGVGVFHNTTAPITYHLGDTSATHQTWHVASPQLDWWCIDGPTMPEVLDRYTAITGRPGLPPRWSYGLWMSKMSYRTQDEVLDVAAGMRQRRIPCDVIHVDTDWFAEPWINNLRFSDERFPDPAAMTSALASQGFRLTLWQIPYLAVRSELYLEALALGLLAMKPSDDGSRTPAHIGGFFGQAGVIDFSHPDAAEWYGSHLRPLFDAGVAAIKTDFGEGAPERAEYHGVSGIEMHNLYPLLYNRAVFEQTARFVDEPMVWARSATAGSQQYPVHWGGDPTARWEDLGHVLAGGLSLAMSGFPFWSHDIGAFAGRPSAEMYVRWAQSGLFMTHPRAHGANNPREPWTFGSEAEEIFRHWAEVRYRLLPYVWGEAEALAPTGQPMMRPLVIDHADDRATHHVHDQFRLGRHLMVAPVVEPGDGRQVYFPSGRWVRWPDGGVVEGPGWQWVDAALSQLPLFLAEGAVLVSTLDVAQHTGEVDLTRLHVDVTPPRPGCETIFRLLDGDDAIVIRSMVAEGRWTIEMPASRCRTLRAWIDGHPRDFNMTSDTLVIRHVTDQSPHLKRPRA